MIVVDASVVVDLVLNTPAAPAISAVLFAPGETLHAPHLIDLEVTHVIRRHCLWGDLSPRDGLEALEILSALRLERHPHLDFLRRIWQLRANLSTYDAAYVALAETLHCPLLTRDQALASSPGHLAGIRLI